MNMIEHVSMMILSEPLVVQVSPSPEERDLGRG
jgi:hypothetical protein